MAKSKIVVVDEAISPEVPQNARTRNLVHYGQSQILALTKH